MSSWLRWISGATGALLLFLCAPCPALAQTPAEKADQLNSEGKKLFGEKRYLEASKKFRQAIVLHPDARYYFNLCFTLNFLERYPEALEQCRLVETAQPDEELQKKTDQLIVELEKRVPQQPMDPGTGNPGDNTAGTGGGATDGGTGDPGQPPPDGSGGGTGNTTGATTGVQGSGSQTPAGPANPFVKKKIPGNYSWALGGEIGVLSNLNIGKTDVGNNYAGGGPNLRLYADFMLSEARQLGWQAYVGFASLASTPANTVDQNLSIVDIGAALYTHRRLTDHLFWTPLGGLNVSMQKAVDTLSNEAFVTLGLRGEVALAYVFGTTGQHALTFTPGLNFYFPSADAVGGYDAADFGLDRPGAALTFNVGYTARFASPFGMAPIINLE